MTALLIVGAVLLLALAAQLVIAENCLRMVVHPVRYRAEETAATDRANGFGAAIDAYERDWARRPFKIESDGADIAGEIIENPAAKNKAVIVCHGHTVNRIASLKYADIFYRAGYSLLIYDERYFGESTGDFCTLGQKEAEDLATLYTFAKWQFGQDCAIGLHGESMGAATALLSLRSIRPAFVVADCPFADSEQLFGQWIRGNLHIPPGPVLAVVRRIALHRYGYRIRETSPIAAVRESETPICFMHGRADSLIPCSHSEALFAACRNEKSELHLFDGAEHAQSLQSDPAGYERILLAFLENVQDKTEL